jgi:hypothetical protein
MKSVNSDIYDGRPAEKRGPTGANRVGDREGQRCSYGQRGQGTGTK